MKTIYCKIIDKITNNIIMAGKVCGIKSNCGNIILKHKLISTDYSHFFHSIGNNKYKTEISDIEIPQILLDPNIELNTKLWKEFDGLDLNIDCFLDNNINQLDEPIAELIFTLNKLDGVYTSTSCCGHNRKPAYIEINFSTFESIKRFLLLLQEHNLKLYKYWHINFIKQRVYVNFKDTTLINYLDEKGFPLCLQCNDIGYKGIDLLNMVINNYIANGYFKLKSSTFSLFNQERF